MIVWQEHGAKFKPEPVSNIGRIRGFASKKATLSKCLVGSKSHLEHCESDVDECVCVVITLEFSQNINQPAAIFHFVYLPIVAGRDLTNFYLQNDFF